MWAVSTSRAGAGRGLDIAEGFYWRPWSLCPLILLHPIFCVSFLVLNSTELIFRWIQLDCGFGLVGQFCKGTYFSSFLHGCKERGHRKFPLPLCLFCFLYEFFSLVWLFFPLSLQFMKELFPIYLPPSLLRYMDTGGGAGDPLAFSCFFKGIWMSFFFFIRTFGSLFIEKMCWAITCC